MPNPQSSKAKGRLFQQEIRDRILANNPELHLDDVRSTSMGAPGQDILLSPLAQTYVPLDIECKRRKTMATLYKWYAQAEDNSTLLEPALFIRADHKKSLAVVDAEFFLKLLRKSHDKHSSNR